MHKITVYVAGDRSAGEVATWLRSIGADIRLDGAGNLVAIDHSLTDAERAAITPSRQANVLPLRRRSRHARPSRTDPGDAA
ncbi:hypothetical protein [Marichromatium gracile]|uniref:hypothetical protein n=1 Tax=Marichromatium gracile TaxID=1048 RepID=UPI001290006F|nr:hypothetical protein [Marichromatium gracile]